MASSVLGAIPLNSFLESFLETGFRAETEFFFRARGVECAARLTVRLCGIPPNLAFEIHKSTDQCDEFLDGDFHSRADIHRLRFVIAFGGENYALGRIFYEKKFPARFSRSPNVNKVFSFFLRFGDFADKSRDYV